MTRTTIGQFLWLDPWDRTCAEVSRAISTPREAMRAHLEPRCGALVDRLPASMPELESHLVGGTSDAAALEQAIRLWVAAQTVGHSRVSADQLAGVLGLLNDLSDRRDEASYDELLAVVVDAEAGSSLAPHDPVPSNSGDVASRLFDEEYDAYLRALGGVAPSTDSRIAENVAALVHKVTAPIDEYASSLVLQIRYWGASRRPEWPDLPTTDEWADFRWLRMTAAERDKLHDDVRRTLLWWRLGAPAMDSDQRPGVTDAIWFGHQLPLVSHGRVRGGCPLGRSAMWHSVQRLSMCWRQLVANEPRWVNWCAHHLSSNDPHAAQRAIRWIAEAKWGGRAGRRTYVPLQVSGWTCARCERHFLPGDATHDTPGQQHVAASIEDPKSPQGRVLRGLPARALPHHRLMCGATTAYSDEPCWHRGGVLIPVL